MAYQAKLWRIDGRKPVSVPVVAIEGLAALGWIGVLPEQRLARKARYRIEHTINRDGEQRSYSAVFSSE